jgi:signal transduction histidine kinase
LRIRRRLIHLVLVAALPAALLSALVSWIAYRDQLASFQTQLRETTRAVMFSVDRELGEGLALGRGLASSPHLEADALDLFHKQVLSAVADADHWVVVHDVPTGRQLINTKLPFGAALPSWDDAADWVRECVATRRPIVKNIELTRTDPGWAFVIQVPVIHEDRVRQVLAVVVHTRVIQRALEQQRLPEDWTAAVLDRGGTRVARVPDPTGFVGQRARPEFLERVAADQEGFQWTESLDRVPVLVSFNRSAAWSWTIAIAVPRRTINASLYRSVVLTLLGSLTLMAISVIAAVRVGKSLTGPVQRLDGAAAALARNERVQLPPSGIAEVDSVGRALEQAGAELAARTAERDRTEEALHDAVRREQQARQEAETANRAKDEFLAMLGHELRNPLGAITSAVSVLTRSVDRAAPASPALDVIVRQVRHLARLVDDLLDVGRVIARKIVLVPGPLDLCEAGRRALATVETSRQGERRNFVVDCDPVWIRADSARIEQVVTNLVSNACKFTRENGTITLRVKAEDGVATLTVADDGAGIAPEMLPRVFDLFFQGSTTLDRAQGGLGLGLTLVRELVALHQGSVTAESAGPGRGSTFTVRLPRIAPPAIETPLSPAEPRAVVRRRILLVEDNADSREMLKTCLEIAGHEVREAGDGPEGIRAVRELRPDVAIIDIGLPGADGYSVAREIRAMGSDGIKLVAVTGYGQEDDRRRALEAGFDTHITKPVDPFRLVDLVQELTAS